jgi:hypothetical protein
VLANCRLTRGGEKRHFVTERRSIQIRAGFGLTPAGNAAVLPLPWSAYTLRLRPVELAPGSPAARPRSGAPKSALKSRITNNSALLPGVDGRSAWVRRCRDLIELHVADLGGEEATSAAERSIVRRAAVLTVELERLEARFALADAASPDDLDLYQRTAGNLRRLLEAVGLRRRPRDVTPSLAEYLASRREAAPGTGVSDG